MVILKAYGFDIYANMAEFLEEEDISSPTTTSGKIVSPTVGRFGGPGFQISNDDVGFNIEIPDTTTLFFSGSFKYNAPWGTLDNLIHFRSLSGTHFLFRNISGTNTIVIQSPNTVDIGTFDISPVVWHRLEIKFKVDDTTGNVTIRVDEVEVFTFEGDTQFGADNFVSTIEIDGNAGRTISWDDIVINDDQGGVNDDFLGDLRIETLRPDGETPQIDFTPSEGGDNSLMVDEAPGADGDTTYVSSVTVGHQDLYTSTDIDALTPTIHAVVVKGKVKKDDGSPRSIKFLANTGTIGSSASQLLLTDYQFQSGVFDTDPSTDGAEFTEANVTVLEMGVEVV